MAIRIGKYITNPKQAFSHKFSKIRNQWFGVAVQFLAGNYTGKTIGLDWKGQPLRSDLINAIISAKGYKTYLEIGCRNDETFGVVNVPSKVGVDPKSGGTHRMTSDAFFAQNNATFDIIFIDGLHIYEQARQDLINSAKALNENGTILIHDCLPTSCHAQYRFPVIDSWNGDVWKAFIEARTLSDLDAATCLIDDGVGVIKKRKNSNPLRLDTVNVKRLKYACLVDNYETLMNTMSYKAALEFACA